MSHISDPPIFCSTCIHTCLYRGFVLVHGGFCSGVCLGVFCLEGFVRGSFCPPPLLSEYIHYNRKPNITFNFRFHMYEICLKSVMSHALGPPSPCHKLSHLLGPPPPSSMMYFMDGPYLLSIHIFIQNSLHESSSHCRTHHFHCLYE